MQETIFKYRKPLFGLLCVINIILTVSAIYYDITTISTSIMLGIAVLLLLVSLYNNAVYNQWNNKNTLEVIKQLELSKKNTVEEINEILKEQFKIRAYQTEEQSILIQNKLEEKFSTLQGELIQKSEGLNQNIESKFQQVIEEINISKTEIISSVVEERKQIEKQIHLLKEEFEVNGLSRYQKITEQITSLNSESLSTIEKATEQVLNKLKANIEIIVSDQLSNKTEILSQLKRLNEETEKEINTKNREAIEIYQQQSDKLTELVNELSNSQKTEVKIELKNLVAGIESIIRSINDGTLEQYKEQSKQLKDQVNQVFDIQRNNIEDRFNQQLSLSNELSEQLKSVSENVDSVIPDSIHELSEKLAVITQNTNPELHSEIINLINNIGETLNRFRELLLENNDEQQKVIDTSTQDILTHLNTKVSDISDLLNEHSNEQKDIESSSLAQIIGELKESSLKLNNSIDQNAKQLTDQNETLSEKIDTNFTQLAVDVESGFNLQSQKINNHSDKIDRIELATKQSIGELLNNISEKLIEINTDSSSLFHGITNSIETVKLSLDKINFKSESKLLLDSIKDLENKIPEVIHNNESIARQDDYARSKYELNILYNRIDSLLSIHSILDLNAPLPIMHEWTVSSDYALTLLTTALEKGKGSFIDVGSGISTILLGYAAKQNGTGKVIALEHSEEFYKKTQSLIKFHNLEKYCEVKLCPLTKYKIDGEEWLWYDIKKVKIDDRISLLSVDGPPGNTQKHARFPALPLLFDTIDKDTTIFLDDAMRTDEREIAQKWSDKYSLQPKLIRSHKNYFVINLPK